MIVSDTLFLFSVNNLMRLDILIWVVGILVLLASVVALYYQRRYYFHLTKELGRLEEIKRHSIEYELVLKTMRLSIWRIDVPTRTITFDSDYRDAVDNVVFASGVDIPVIISKMDGKYVEKVQASMMDLLEGRSDDFHEQYEMKAPDSDRTFWSESFATIEKRDKDGRPLTIVGASMRIDKQKEIEAALIDARNHAEESDRLKTAFLANMSHEVRTPLNAIVGFSDVLPMVQNDEERQELIALIRKNNAQLIRLFEDMVSMSKLEAGNDQASKRRFDLHALLAEVVDKYTSRSVETGVELRLEMKNNVPQPFTDPERLREILSQYVDNALKFTAVGSVTVGYSVHDGRLRIWVRDTGKGIPADMCNEHLFERFVKVDDFIPGTGLGLAICRGMAMSLGGKVGVESKLGEGSNFWVEVPLG